MKADFSPANPLPVKTLPEFVAHAGTDKSRHPLEYWINSFRRHHEKLTGMAGRVFFRLVPWCLVALMPSCVVATKDTYVSLGGKSAYKSATFGVVHDHEASFREGTLAATLVAGAYYSAATAAAKEVTSRTAAKEGTKLGIIQSNNAKDIAIEGIKADVTKATFVPP